MKSRFILLICLSLMSFQAYQTSTVFITKTGWVKFTSEAPLELIQAENNSLGAVLDIEKKTLAFRIPIESFEGFNSPFQREHFNENYMESDKFPNATFTGKLIEDNDLSVPGTYKMRSKGMLTIHGVEKERVVSGKIIVKPTSIEIESSFEIPLEDHNILIPKIVYQKIAEVIAVEVKASLKK